MPRPKPNATPGTIILGQQPAKALGGNAERVVKFNFKTRTLNDMSAIEIQAIEDQHGKPVSQPQLEFLKRCR